jgi:hypothetical protein
LATDGWRLDWRSSGGLPQTIPDSPLSPADQGTDGDSGLSPEERALMETIPRDDLITMLTKQKMLTKRYQRKLNDLVSAYKDVAMGKTKLEAALENQQDVGDAITAGTRVQPTCSRSLVGGVCGLWG